MPIDLQTIDTGAAARLRVALAGEGPLIVLIHGFPESWYSWRHQIPVLAEAGFRVAAPDVRGYGGSDKPHAIDAYPAGPGLLDRLVDPVQFPSWLTDADLDYYASQFRDSGFRGPLNRYRNSERDFADLAEMGGQRIAQPSAFLAGSLEPVLGMIPGVDMVERMRAQCADLRQIKIMEGAGHWLQQERPAEVNAALLEFLGTLDR
jgi:pimeloyl-ACP methyl ester carboxylesterase